MAKGLKQIKLGFIGLGQRGHVLMETVLKIFSDVEVTAVCDTYADRVADLQNIIEEARGMRPAGYVDAAELLKDENVNTVVISAAWEAHVPLAVASMEAGKITALEVGGAYAIDDCWKLVNTYERTKTPFMFLENCCFGKYELFATNMARKGLLGEVVHCHGAYCHDIRNEIASGVKIRHYRLRNYLNRNCENYPTHELGPIAKLLNINRGNRMLSLVSMSSKARGLHQYVQDKEEFAFLKNATFRQGDVVETLITCTDGTMISIKLDTSLPRPGTREFTVSGAKGFYSQIGNVLFLDEKETEEKGLADCFQSATPYEETYMPKIWKEITPEEIEAGHGGMDTLLFRAFFNAIKAGDEMPIDVYDAASWMAITCLSEASIAAGGAPVSIPDFTGGKWVMREPKDVIDFDKE
ncbi:MAG: Gfo/Idh/MocA family oxidoreductase [Clostridia bacterium]|nr:Gfo/Idh/MocA family oxidoreductase [Clostridia bacterium]